MLVFKYQRSVSAFLQGLYLEAVTDPDLHFQNADLKRSFSYRGVAGLPEPVREPDMKYTGIFINNEWLEAESGKTFPTINPANGQVVADQECQISLSFTIRQFIHLLDGTDLVRSPCKFS